MAEKDLDWYREVAETLAEANGRITRNYVRVEQQLREAQDGWERALDTLAKVRTLADELGTPGTSFGAAARLRAILEEAPPSPAT